MRLGFNIARIVTLACLSGGAALAQPAQPTNVNDAGDPARRALERIESIVAGRAVEADRAAAAVKLVRQSAEARKLGDEAAALAALAEAEQIAGEETQRGELIEALLQRIADERQAIKPKAAAIEPTSWQLPDAAPRIALTRYQAYREPLIRILIEERLPTELLAVAMIESRFNPLALSPKGARGIWQLMPATASRYGLRVVPADDQRTHPEHSTRAAARYLRDLYRQFGDWELALAAYNAGEARVQRIIDQTGVRAFAEMARRRLLPLETRQYVPAVMAVWIQLSSNGAAMR